jgi:uncharacterized protein YeaO (DUF488 family)
MSIRIKRAYEPPSPQDGARILVDRLWPRGVSKEKLKLEEWMKEIAPSTELRQWFHTGDHKWADFRERYFQELHGRPELVAELRKKARGHTVTLIYGARDAEQNNAVALKDYLEGKAR